MSDATFDALEEALRAHIADSVPDFPILTDWHLTAASVGGNADFTQYSHWCSDSPWHSLAGLTIAARARFRQPDDGS